jgi:hypothetical protein
VSRKMIRRGITTTGAAYWVHIHVLDRVAYWYSVARCLAYIKRHSLVTVIARSKDPEKTETATGYLVPKSALFVAQASFEIENAKKFATYMLELSDREFGFYCEEMGKDLISSGKLRLPFLSMRDATEAESSLWDIESFNQLMLRIEFKGERRNTRNLFVQEMERDHKATFAPDGTERKTEKPPFGEDSGVA